MAFRDGGNDISTLKSVKVRIARENAADNVKKIAYFLTKYVDNHGIEKALIHFGLLDKNSTM